MNPGSRKIFRAKPPDKGSFPLDHDGMEKFPTYQMLFQTKLLINKNHSVFHQQAWVYEWYLTIRRTRTIVLVWWLSCFQILLLICFAVDTRGTILTGCVLYRIYHFLCNIEKIRVSHWLGKCNWEKKLVCQIGKSINHNLFVSYKPFATLCM